jgi:16S rRNA (guanine(966)-N(2))-methyltransferase RsmD
MKIISGTLKGRTIDGFNIEGTRPTMDRVKESLFGMIQTYIKDSICLDLFTGSGNLAFEAISNGSRLCYFNDKNIKCINIVKKNIKNFNIEDKTKVLNLDYNKCLDYLKDNNIKLDIIFLDPPYKNECLNDIIDKILVYDLLNNNGIIVCEVDKDYLNKDFSNLEIIKNRKYGDKFIIIYEKN